MRPLLVLLTSLALAGCADSDSPEAQVRGVIAAIETAAEARDVGDVMAHVSSQFTDSYGRDGRQLAQYVRGYFLANQSIHLLTRIDGIELPTQDEARVKVTVGMLGRDAADAWDLAAEIREIDVTLMREDGQWRVTYARWARPR